jgi:hypothetical protein
LAQALLPSREWSKVVVVYSWIAAHSMAHSPAQLCVTSSRRLTWSRGVSNAIDTCSGSSVQLPHVPTSRRTGWRQGVHVSWSCRNGDAIRTIGYFLVVYFVRTRIRRRLFYEISSGGQGVGLPPSSNSTFKCYKDRPRATEKLVGQLESHPSWATSVLG